MGDFGARVLHYDWCEVRCAFSDTDRIEIMVSAWWIIWAFIIGGYAGMLLLALLVVARKARAPGSVFE